MNFDLKQTVQKHPQSEALWERAERVIPGGTQTFSKGPSQVVPGTAPKYLVRGKGCRVTDADGHQYIDYTMGLLSLILGYADDDVNEAVRKQLADGSNFSLMHPLEVEVAERIVDLVPCAEMVRFGKNGSDATSGAIRLARAYPGRDHVACCGYHGWQDWYIGTTTRSAGVPPQTAALTHPFVYNDIASLEAIFDANPDKVAAVIIEPVTFEAPADGFLEGVRDLTHRHGAVLIFDEMITGFRFALGGAQEKFGVTPDLATFGKALANGFPLSAVTGKAELMRLFEDVFFSFTFGGETMSLAAAAETLNQLVEREVPAHLERVGGQLKAGAQKLITDHGLTDVVSCIGLPTWTCMTFSGPDPSGLKTLFQQECIKREVLFMANHNISFSHDDEVIALTLDVYDQALQILSDAVKSGRVDDLLDGPRVEPVFRAYS